MHLAILGATSQIARDFVGNSAAAGKNVFSLYARRPDVVQRWAQLAIPDANSIVEVGGFESFGKRGTYDAVINFVGVGDPATAQRMGAAILDITLDFDSLALRYVKAHPSTRYLFLSSGAAYGSDFQQPATDQTRASFDINHLQAQDWYGAAKFHAECRHRALAGLPIVDLRVFSYFSRAQDLSSKFLISDMLRAIRDDTVMSTSMDTLVRDFLHPKDFSRLAQALIHAPPTNAAVDAYTLAPTTKPELLTAMQQRFGLKYESVQGFSALNATGRKSHYYSLNRRAQEFGYQPQLSSLDGVLMEASSILSSAT
ncbi:NAD(P)-dependent oxidoreductase [Hydrogenophaga sp.]|uniref:NAD-dependent epimerase/dehydratase family protein n=1 Tax=Hydrogenophaga sp. TaxID=1904254 RepID=UPI002718ED26|nr:NAD-dependent epimerase/dehydratase family protein [Hydrogenophaga sp.]MDO9132645.1 NAD-dependent epimerase/dehydratase family protein [Hydrogenophaga sp.]